MGDHTVQFYGNDSARLTRNVASYLSEALNEGGGAMVVACADVRDALRRELGSVDVAYLDDRETLAQILGPDGRPDPAGFEAAVGTRARRMTARYPRVRAYGEMVSVLWLQGACEAALQLESLWNGLMVSVPFDLFCGYAIDVLSADFQIAGMHPVLAAHTRVAQGIEPAFDGAMEHAMEKLWGERNSSLRSLANEGFSAVKAEIPPAERTILRLRSSLPRYAERILSDAVTALREAQP